MLRANSALLLSLVVLCSVTFADDKTVPMKTIELEWEAVENAGSYEVKLIPESGSEPLIFQVPENILSREVPIGNYVLQMRARSKDGSDYSSWTQAIPLAVIAKELLPIQPKNEASIEGFGQPKHTVEFQWTPVENVKEYTLIVWSEDHKDKPYTFTTKLTQKKIEVPVAQVYYWQVKFSSADDVAYQQAPKTFSFTLLGDKLTKPEIAAKIPPIGVEKLTLKGPRKTQKYTAKLYFHYLDKSYWKDILETETKDAFLNGLKLKPGAYKLEVVAKANRQMSSEPAIREFTIKPKAVDLELALTQAGLTPGP